MIFRRGASAAVDAFAGIVAVGLTMFACPAGADQETPALESAGPSTVIIELSVASSATSDVARRIAAELQLAGFAVEVVVPGRSPTNSNPFARIRIAREGGVTVARVLDTLAGDDSSMAQTLDASDVEPELAHSVLAVRTVEHLRARLVDATKSPGFRATLPADIAKWLEEAPSAALSIGSAPPPAPTNRAEERIDSSAGPIRGAFSFAPGRDMKDDVGNQPDPNDLERLWLGAGFAQIFAGGALVASLGARIDVRYSLPYSFSFGTSFTTTGPFIQVEYNAVQFLLLAEATYAFGTAGWVVSPFVSASIGVHGLHTTENVSPRGRETKFGFVAAPGLGIRFELTSWAHFILEASALFVAPEPAMGDELSPVGGYYRSHLPLVTQQIGFELAPAI